MQQDHKKIWTGLACWAFLFSPALFEGVSPGSVGLWLAAVWLFSCVVLWRPVLIAAVAFLLLLGAVNIVHVAFMGGLADQLFLATVLRTNWQESKEFWGVVPWSWLMLALAWLGVGGWCGRQLWLVAPACRQVRHVRMATVVALLVWLVFLIFVAVKGYSFEEVSRKVKTLYPMHIVRAWSAQNRISESLFYTPAMPEQMPDRQGLDTLVVVLGESASAQRWSLLGYEAADTNAALRNVSGLQVIRAMSHGLNTAATLPFLLTGMDADASVAYRAPSFIDLAKQAGYKTFVISNSRYHSTNEDFYGIVMRRAADVFTKAGNGEWDEVLTAPLQQALADPAPRKLIVLHTYGSHFQVTERYPKTHAVFEDAYDNTVHYTSSLLAQWIALLDQSAADKQGAMLLYSSDHGVAMPPCADQYRTGSGLSSLQVPLLVWSNAALSHTAQSLVPQFSEQEKLVLSRSHATVAEMAAQAVGYSQGLVIPADSPAKSLSYRGRRWEELQQLDACTLR